MITKSCRRVAYDDSRDALLRVAVALQVLGDCGEDAGWERHVEDPVGLVTPLLELLKVLFELDEGIVLVVLSRDVCAEATELF
jgi:hypothetical protein